MKYDESEILSVGHLIQNLESHIGDYNGPVWFRGHAKCTWNLEPRLMRMTPLPSETFYLNKFKQDASIILPYQPKGEFEWLFLMQHYGVPTRLLDWSESPLAALYFAVNGELDIDGTLWVLLPTELNKRSNYRPEFEFEVPSFEDEYLENYFPKTISKESKSKLFPVAAIAPRNSPRMQAQQGVFTITHRENIFLDDVGAEGNPRDYIWKYSIPKESKEVFLKELKWLGINRFQLFPELESLAYNLR